MYPTRPHELLIREEKRPRSSGYWVAFEAIYCVGAKQAAEEARREKLAARKARKGGSR